MFANWIREGPVEEVVAFQINDSQETRNDNDDSLKTLNENHDIMCVRTRWCWFLIVVAG